MGKAHKLLKRAAKLARKAQRKLTKGVNTAPGAFVKLAQIPNESRVARARMRGWNDVAKGKPYRDSYDEWKKPSQLAYERGRQEATLALRVSVPKGKLSFWAMSELIQGPMYRSCGAMHGERIIEEMRKTVRSVK